jgi:hypothetical protein
MVAIAASFDIVVALLNLSLPKAGWPPMMS